MELSFQATERKGLPHDEWVFPAPGGRFLRYDNFRHRVWSGATTAAGIAPFDFHELRHTAAALMISEGANALQVKRRMGHEDVRTTFNIYGHLFDDDEDALVQRLDQRARRASRGRVLGFCWVPEDLRASRHLLEGDKVPADQDLL